MHNYGTSSSQNNHSQRKNQILIQDLTYNSSHRSQKLKKGDRNKSRFGVKKKKEVRTEIVVASWRGNRSQKPENASEIFRDLEEMRFRL